MPDILLEVASGMYFYMRDDKNIGLSIEIAGEKPIYVAFTFEQLYELVGIVASRFADNVKDCHRLRETNTDLLAKIARLQNTIEVLMKGKEIR